MASLCPDACASRRELAHSLRHHLPGHEVVTASYAGFAGLKNGHLLKAAEDAGFEVLVTGDKTLHHEQDLTGRKLAIVSLSAISWPLIESHLPKVLAAIDHAAHGSFTRVECGSFTRSRKLKGPTLD